MTNPRVFISYRRNDTRAISRLIYEDLRKKFGAEHVFFDIDSIDIGQDFHRAVRDHIEKCNVLLAIIGDRWAEGRNLFAEDSYVRMEIRTALSLGVPTVPIFADGARGPSGGDVPIDLHPILRANGLSVDSGRDFQNHMAEVAKCVERLAGQFVPKLPPAAPQAPGVQPNPSRSDPDLGVGRKERGVATGPKQHDAKPPRSRARSRTKVLSATHKDITALPRTTPSEGRVQKAVAAGLPTIGFILYVLYRTGLITWPGPSTVPPGASQTQRAASLPSFRPSSLSKNTDPLVPVIGVSKYKAPQVPEQ